MRKLFSIGEVADIKGVTIKALRYYHKLGILTPAYIDKETHYRYYSLEQFIYIDVIKVCRFLGVSIKELQKIFIESNTENTLKFLILKRYETEQKMKKMKEVLNTIDKLNDSIKYAKKVSINEEITIQYFKKRFIVTGPCEEVGDLKEILYYSDLDRVIQEKNLETTMESGIIYSINSKGDFEPRYVFRVLCENDYIHKENDIDMLPEGKYLTLAFSKSNEEESIAKLHDYVKDNNLKINKYIEVELLDDIFNTDSYSCQIQLLIEDEAE
ncbi:MerR family transcriptional regulator [Oceanobacillus picturae]|uniref:MerR family transcriptional regulator n=1 Tax=Oceanobacillus picturae TaxID=171693 RepID=UPI003640EFBA